MWCVRIRCRTSGYEIVRQDTMSYVRIRCHIRCKQNSATPHTHSTENKNIVNSLRSLWKSFWHFSVMWPKHVVLPFLMSTTFSNRTYAQTPASAASNGNVTSSTEGRRRGAIPSTSTGIVFETKIHRYHRHSVYDVVYDIVYDVVYDIVYDIHIYNITYNFASETHIAI